MDAKTVRVRIAVSVDKNGKWNSCGWSSGDDEEMMGLAVDGTEDGEARYFLEADLALPTEATPLGATVIPVEK